MIDSGDVSVVVQGPVVGQPGDAPSARLTRRCLASVRRHLPRAEVVLSTWRGTDVSGLSFDRLVSSDDPGGMRCDDWPNVRASAPARYNANRQIVSSRAGLHAASRPYAIKLRSDMLLTGTGFFRYFGRYRARSPQWRILGERVVTPNWWSRNPRGASRMPFNPSDWFHFGLRDDVLALWDVPLTDAEMPLWYASRPRPPEYGDTHLLYRYTVEQYTWLAFLRKHGEVPLEHKLDANPAAVALSELTLVNNLVVADMAALGLRFVKYPSTLTNWGTLYTHGEWQQLYRKYCDPAFVPEPDPVQRRKDFYNAWIAPAHRVVVEPRSVEWARALSAGWESRSPRTFRAAKRAYVAGWSSVARLLSRRA